MSETLTEMSGSNLVAPREDGGLLSRNAMQWLLAANALTGIAVGYIAGASESPITGTLIPLLFTLITSGANLYISTADVRAAAVSNKVRTIGMATVALVIGCLGGSVYGIQLRTGLPLTSFLVSLRANQNAQVSLLAGKDLRSSAELIGFRARLRLLGADDGEIETFLNQLVTESSGAPVDLKRQLEAVAALVAESKKYTDAAIPALGTRAAGQLDGNSYDDFRALVSSLDEADYLCQKWLPASRAGQFDWNETVALRQSLGNALDKFLTDNGGALRKLTEITGKAPRALVGLKAEMRIFNDIFDGERVRARDLAQSMDQIIQFQRPAAATASSLTRRPGIKP